MKINPWKLLEQYPPFLVQALIALAREKSAPCYIAGGTVRDFLMGGKARDLDITVAEDGFGWAGELALKLPGTFIPMDEEEDTARVVWQKVCVDFSSFREGARTIEEDLLKRDFTINSMAVPFPAEVPAVWDDAEPPKILDPADGQKDLRNKIIRSNSATVFVSDPLRLLRAYRFMAAFGFMIDPLTKNQIQEHVHLLFLVAEERIANELDAIMAVPESIATVAAMHENDVLEELLPELYRGIGVEQPASHHLDVFAHGVATLKQMENVQKDPGRFFPGYDKLFNKYLGEGRRKVLLKWAALCHDIGKPITHAVKENERITFYSHDKEGARIFTIIADRFKWSREDRNLVSGFISFHMWPFHLNNVRRKAEVTPKAYMRLVKTVGAEFPGLFLLAMADSLAGRGAGKPPGMEEDLAGLFQEVENAFCRKIKPVLAARLLNGNDLIDIFGLTPGPVFREIFAKVEEAQIEGRVKNRSQALGWVANYLKSIK